MNELEMSRKEISRIDAEMARLFEQRMKVCGDIAEYKRKCGLSVRDTAREAELIERNRALIESEDVEGYYVQFMKNTIDLGIVIVSAILKRCEHLVFY